MAERVGTGVTGGGTTTSTTIASSAKSTTSGNVLIAHAKWENAGVAITGDSLSDTAGNTWVVLANVQNGGTSQPGTCLAYAKNIVGNASNVVTLTLSGSADFRNIIVEEFSGLDLTSPEDGNEQTNSAASGTSHTTGDITTSGAGLVFIGVGIFAAISSVTGTPGNPDFTVGATAGESAVGYLISTSGQTVTPGLGNSTSAQWNAIAQAFKDAPAHIVTIGLGVTGQRPAAFSPGLAR